MICKQSGSGEKNKTVQEYFSAQRKYQTSTSENALNNEIMHVQTRTQYSLSVSANRSNLLCFVLFFLSASAHMLVCIVCVCVCGREKKSANREKWEKQTNLGK